MFLSIQISPNLTSIISILHKAGSEGQPIPLIESSFLLPLSGLLVSAPWGCGGVGHEAVLGLGAYV